MERKKEKILGDEGSFIPRHADLERESTSDNRSEVFGLFQPRQAVKPYEKEKYRR